MGMIEQQTIDSLKAHIEKLLHHGVILEPNTSTIQTWFRSVMNIHLSQLSDAELIRDYYVVCDEHNNTTDIVDANCFVAEVYIRNAPKSPYTRLEVMVSPEIEFTVTTYNTETYQWE